MNCEDFFKELSKVTEKFSPSKSLPDIHRALKEFYRIIQKCQIQYENSSELTLEHQDIVFALVQHLVSVLSNNIFPADSILLSGTCLAVLVADLFPPDFTSRILVSLYYYVAKEVSGGSSSSNSPDSIAGGQPFKDIAQQCIEQSCGLDSAIQEFIKEENESGSNQFPKFHEIALLHGILSCQKSNLFPYISKHFKQKPFLIVMFNPIYRSCLTPCSSQYHAFSVLVNWLKTFERHHLDILKDTEVVFSSNSQIVSKILALLVSNWESPIKGVSGFVKEAYRILIGLSMAECDLLKTSDFNIVDLLLEQVMKLSWKIKGKYLVLSVALQFTDYRKFLEKNPEVPYEVIFNVRANYASSVTSEVYKAIVTSMKESNSSDDFHVEWSKWWKIPIIESICSNNKLLVQNVTNLVLPWTLRMIPKSYELILDGFERETIAPQLLLLRIAKESSICVLRKKEIRLLRKYLHHQSIQLRIEIISIICCSPKKSEQMSFEELELLKDFIVVNLNIDSTPFQQQFLSQLRILLVRIRDSLVQEFRLTSKNPNIAMSPHQLEFVDWLAHKAVANTFPGACFQRRRLSLHILNIIFDVFVISPLGNKRKEKPSKYVEQLIEATQSKGLWKFFKDDLLLNIFPCITDFTDEIRTSTCKLILEFTNWPAVSVENAILGPESLMKYAHSLCNHPDYRSNDGGALLVSLIYRKLHVKNSTFSESECDAALMFLSDIVQSTTSQLKNIRRNLPNADPIHGYLLALQYCMNSSKDVLATSFRTHNDKTMNFIQTITDLCDDVIEYMLGVMKGNNEKNNCPSFSDIGQAIEKLVISKQANSSDPFHDDDNDTVKFNMKDTYSPEVELMLSCCWHSIKNSCFLLCELSFCICELDMQIDIKKPFLLNVANKLSSILITCRHRGVVDACCLALNKFCTLLLKDAALHEEICTFLLNSVFDSLSDATSTSVTRRSAGLPSLIQAVVSSEQNNIKRKLLSFTVDKLLICVHQPLTPTGPISDKTDLPQAHAYHILKSLVTDSSLAQAILSHLDDIIPACVAGFSSSLWPIRNGALQLFGVLLPRICGQKKVRDDDSEHNLVSASELFARCPSLKTYLTQQLKKCVNFHHNKKLCSELVPVLSVIVKLSPPQGENGDSGNEFRTFLLELLNVPIWNVRDLVSSALSVLMTISDIIDQIEELRMGLQMESINCNEIHGILLMIQKFVKRNNGFPNQHSIVASLVELYNALIEKSCPILLGILLDIILEVTIDMDSHHMMHIFKSLKIPGMKQPFGVGQTLLDSKLILLMLKAADSSDIPTIVKQQVLKDTSVGNECLRFLNNKLQSEIVSEDFYIESNLKSWKEIYIAVLHYIKTENHPSTIQETLKLMIGLCCDWRAGCYILDSDTSKSVEKLLQPQLEMKLGLSSAALSLTMLSLCIKSDLQRKTESTYLHKWSTLFNSYCQPRSPDILRMQAACSVAFLGPTLVEYLLERIQQSQDSHELLIGLSEGSLLLLQDEDEEIRNKACEFPSKLPHQYEISSLQFNIGIQVVFQCVLRPLQDDSNFLLYLWNRLQNYPSTSKVLHGLRSINYQKKMNLFEQEYVNVYAEPIKILLEYKELFKNALEVLHTRNCCLWHERIEMFLSDLKIEISDMLNLLSCEPIKEHTEGFAYPHQGFLALKKIHCQLEVILDQEDLLCSSSLQGSLNELSCDWKDIEKHLTVITCWFLHHL